MHPIQVQKFLKGIDYTDDEAVLLQPTMKEGVDERGMDLLNHLPGRTYDAPTDATQAIGNLE